LPCRTATEIPKIVRLRAHRPLGPSGATRLVRTHTALPGVRRRHAVPNTCTRQNQTFGERASTSLHGGLACREPSSPHLVRTETWLTKPSLGWSGSTDYVPYRAPPSVLSGRRLARRCPGRCGSYRRLQWHETPPSHIHTTHMQLRAIRRGRAYLEMTGTRLRTGIRADRRGKLVALRREGKQVADLDRAGIHEDLQRARGTAVAISAPVR
jgi:hypothetical protein